MQIKSLKFLSIAFMLSLSACSLLQSEPPDETRNWSAQKLYAEHVNASGNENGQNKFQLLVVNKNIVVSVFAKNGLVHHAQACNAKKNANIKRKITRAWTVSRPTSAELPTS